ncbi:LeuA family protein [Halegenticoccus tardaugens]|uniref:LeuA family protein n=1 Tax=Halegenticoccus tardaugens TaxID=2071624 RepID=UPI00100A8876|nr:LeuA family protein [Halegenticoccus tardaugens]
MKLCDVTLREGDQMPGRSYSVEQKAEAGLALDRLGVDFVEAGFPATGEKDRRAVAELADAAEADVAAIARAVPADVEAALEAEADVISVFGPVSSLQLEHALGKTREEMLDAMRDAVDLAHSGGARVHLSLVDAFRTERRYVVDACERFSDAEYVVLADTVGVRTPRSVASTLAALGESVDLGRVGVHFHQDLGVATANVLAAYEAGAGKADVSVASLGERAGNAALEEVVVAGTIEHGESFGVDAARLVPACREVLSALGERVDARKPILGREVAEHESGIHTAAMLGEPGVFEPFDPADFGGERRLVFGAGTGRGGARGLLERAGFEPTDRRVESLLSALADEGPMGTDGAVALARRLFG